MTPTLRRTTTPRPLPHTNAGENAAVLLRLEDLPATPQNLARMRVRILRLNDRLEAQGAPFRLRVT